MVHYMAVRGAVHGLSKALLRTHATTPATLEPMARRSYAPWVPLTLLLACRIGGAFAQSSPVSVQAHLAAARNQLSASHLLLAERELRAALALDPDSADAHFLLGNVLLLNNRPRESLTECTAGARTRRPTAEELTVVASDYVLLNDFPDADKWLHAAVQLDPANARAWYLLGRTQYNQDHNAEAERSFQRVLALHPRDVRAEYNLGLAYERLQRTGEALTAYRTAIAWQHDLAIQDPQPYLDLGTLLLAQDHAADALSAFREAARFGPDNPLTQQEQGRAFESLGRYEEALAAFHRAVSLAPGSQQPHFFLARVLKRLGRNDEARAEYAEVSKMLGTHSDVPTPNTNGHP